MTDPRTKVAEQLGLLLIANIELSAQVAQLSEQLKQAQQRLHEAAADAAGPSGAVSPPDKARGD